MKEEFGLCGVSNSRDFYRRMSQPQIYLRILRVFFLRQCRYRLSMKIILTLYFLSQCVRMIQNLVNNKQSIILKSRTHCSWSNDCQAITIGGRDWVGPVKWGRICEPSHLKAQPTSACVPWHMQAALCSCVIQVSVGNSTRNEKWKQNRRLNCIEHLQIGVVSW